MGPLGTRDGQKGSGVLGAPQPVASDHGQSFHALSPPCATHILILYVSHTGSRLGAKGVNYQLLKTGRSQREV